MVTNIIVTIIGLGVLTLIGFGIYKVVCFILDIVGDVKTKRNDKKRKQIEKEQQDLKRIETFNNLKLQCETIPDTCKQSNLHDIPKYKKEWNDIRTGVRFYSMNQANKMRGFDAKKDKYIGKYKCFNCGETHHHIECHEVWDFDLKTKTQNLVKVVGLCHNCHSACHYGKASNLEKTIYRQWLFVVNRDTFSDLNELEEYLQYCWHKRQSYEGINFQINDESVKKVFDWAREEIKKHKRNNTKAFNITITNN